MSGNDGVFILLSKAYLSLTTETKVGQEGHHDKLKVTKKQMKGLNE